MRNAFSNAFGASGGGADATKLPLAGGTLTGQLIQSTNGAASAPPLTLTGAFFTGGSATTTKPQFLIEPTGTTSTGWSTGGTGLGVNAASGFAGNLIDLQVAGATKFKVDSSGAVFPISGIYSSTTYVGIAPYSASGGAYLTFFNNNPSSGRFSYFDSDAYFSGGYRVLFANARNDAFNCGLKWGAAGTIKVTDATTGYGTIDALGFKVSGTAGANFGPGTPTSITVVNGIITAIS